MKVIETVAEMQAYARAQAAAERTLGFVPTMGALHDGHLDLVRAARKQDDAVAVSIFVNPTQFGPNEDYDSYPRTFDTDIEQLAAFGVDTVFAPPVDEMYPAGNQRLVWVEVESLGQHWCGASRPGFFRGVATVVSKLFHAVQPNRAYFGEKDFQQLTIIRRMVQELLFPVDIVAVPTRREADGLAMSSRNAYLDDEAREAAPGIYNAMRHVQQMFADGERDASVLLANFTKRLDNIRGGELDYAGIADPNTLEPITSGHIEKGRMLCALHLGGARLIDNMPLGND